MMKNRNLIIYDLVGVTATLGTIALGIWLGFVRPTADSARLTTLREHLAETSSSLQSAADELRLRSEKLVELRKNLEDRGALPARSPVEADLSVITRLARDNTFELREVTPIPGKTYPGINELRYAVIGESTFENLVSFLGEFRNSTIWADITQLKIGVTAARNGEATTARSVEFVVSLLASQDVLDKQVAKR